MTKSLFLKKIGMKQDDFEKYVGVALPKGDEIDDKMAQKYREMWKEEVERRASAVIAELEAFERELTEKRRSQKL